MLHICAVRTLLEFHDETELQPWFRPVFRGAFGSVLRALACRVGGVSCAQCALSRTCAYGYIFETPIPPDASRMRLYTHAPHPFVFRTPTLNAVRAGDAIPLDLVLVGKAMEYLPYFLIALEDLGRLGLGQRRVRYALAEARCLHTGRRLDTRSAVGSELRFPIDPEGSVGPEPDRFGRLRLSLVSPLALKHHDDDLKQFAFKPFVSSIIRRVELMGWWHCGTDLRGRYTHLLDRCGDVQVIADDTRFTGTARFSQTQQAHVPVRGLVGEVLLSGNIEPFRGLFHCAEWLGVGNKISFGNGQVAFERPE